MQIRNIIKNMIGNKRRKLNQKRIHNQNQEKKTKENKGRYKTRQTTKIKEKLNS